MQSQVTAELDYWSVSLSISHDPRGVILRYQCPVPREAMQTLLERRDGSDPRHNSLILPSSSSPPLARACYGARGGLSPPKPSVYFKGTKACLNIRRKGFIFTPNEGKSVEARNSHKNCANSRVRARGRFFDFSSLASLERTQSLRRPGDPANEMGLKNTHLKFPEKTSLTRHIAKEELLTYESS